MIIIISVLLGVLAYIGNKYIRKYFNVLLLLSIVISVVGLFIDSELTEIVTQGLIGLAIFVVVMFGGAFKRDSKISKRLRSVRKEYSIIGFILLIPHGLIYIIQFLDGTYPVEWYGVIAMAVMIPLFIISFGVIKKKMNIKTWVQSQKWSYLAYALIFVHLIVVSKGANQISYLIIFGVYSILKVKNYMLNAQTGKTQNLPALLKALILIVLVAGGVSMFDLNIDSVEGVIITEVETENGVYTGYGTGFQNLSTELNVTIDNGVITNIEMIECGCTGSHGGMNYENAAENMIDEIVESQSTDIDTIAGATYTTSSILEAVEDAIEQSQNK